MTKEELRQYRSTKLEICQIARRLAELQRRGGDDAFTQSLRDLYGKNSWNS